VVAVIAVVLLGTAGGGAWWLFGGSGPTPSPPPIPETYTAASSPSTTSAPTTSTTPVDPSVALAAQADADHERAEAVLGYWIPQLSSKQAGMVINGLQYDDARILQDFRETVSLHSDAILVRSGDYTSFRRAGYWVVLVAQPQTSAAAANAWCNAQRIGRDDCFAKRLSHSEGPSGNTVPR
jgi:hypothetical protein